VAHVAANCHSAAASVHQHGEVVSAIRNGADATVTGRRATDKAVREWMRNRVSNWPDDKPPPNEEMDWSAAGSEFGDTLTQREFRIVRKDETPLAWRKQGRRKSWGLLKKSVE
jgi:hypothetical protein